MSIKGIQIKGKVSYISENNNKHVVYITDFEEMTIDTDKSNRIIKEDELLEIVKKGGKR